MVIPSYRAEPYLVTAIDSVLSQSMGDLELVIIDDASPDRSWDLIAAQTDNRITSVRHDRNLGAVETWNRAVEMASAPLVKLLCSDDLIEPGCLASQVAVLEQHPDIAIVSGRRSIIDARGRTVMRRRGLEGMSGRIEGREAVDRLVRSGSNIIGEPSVAMFRRADWERSGRFRDTQWPYMLDADLWTRVLRLGDLWAQDEVVGAFRISGTSWSSVLRGQQGRQARRFFEHLANEPDPMVQRRSARIGRTRSQILAPARRAVFAFAALRSGA